MPKTTIRRRSDTKVLIAFFGIMLISLLSVVFEESVPVWRIFDEKYIAADSSKGVKIKRVIKLARRSIASYTAKILQNNKINY